MPLIENFSPTIFVEGPLYTKVLYVNPVSLDSSKEHGLYAAYRSTYKDFTKASDAYDFKAIGDYAIWTDKDTLIPEGVAILTLVTKRTGRCVPTPDGIKESVRKLHEIVCKTYEEDDRPIIITPLIGCGLGQLVYHDAIPIMEAQFKAYLPFIVVSIHPMNRPDEPIPQITILTDGSVINYTDRDLLERIRKLHHTSDQIRLYVPSYEEKLVAHLKEHYKEEGDNPIDLWVVPVEDRHTLLTREPTIPLLGSNTLMILRTSKSKESMSITSQALTHMDKTRVKIYYFTS